MDMQAPSARKMVSYDDARDYVTSLFIMLKKEPVILFRIEFLVVLVTLLFFAMFLMDFFRRIIHNPFMRAVFSIFDGVSDSIVLYLLGAMQSAPFKNQLFPIWALVLVNFRYSADYISGYGVPDRRGRRFTEWRNVFKLLGSAFLTWTRGSSFTAPLWSVWCLQIVRSFYRFKSHNLAFRSLWHGGSSHLVAEHMHASARYGNSQPAAGPVTMEDYNYLVYGETRRGFKLNKPQYALSARRPKKTWYARCCCFAGESAALTTLDKVWEYCPIHQPHNQDLKDLPLAFALSRLLRCRLEDVTLRGRIFKMNRELIKNIIGGKLGTSDVLRIMELQLAFVHDYFNTRYPMVFWSGRLSLLITLLLSVLTIGAVGWLAVDIRRIYKPPDGELANLVKGFNIDMIITWAFILLMIAKEFWEMVTYLLSDWTSLILVCEYVQRKCKRTRDSVDTRVDRMLLWFSRAKITDKRWHGFIDQYVFMQSYDDRPRFWNFVHNLTTGIIPKKDDGAKLSSAIKIPECVKKAVLEKLSTMVEEKQDCSLPKEKQERSLPKDLKALSNSNVTEQLQKYKAYAAPPMGTDIVLPTSSHVILAWHIATSLCEMELATTHGVNLSNPGFPCSLLSWLTSCCCSKPYLMDLGEKKDGILSWFTSCCSSKSNGKLPDERFTNCCSSKSNGKLPDELREPYTIANSLSRYCAYLLVSKPDLTPDSFLVPKIVFQKTVESARDGILKNCDSLESRRIKLKYEADEPIENSEEDVLKQGAALGKELLKLPDDGVRWKVLEEVWTELLIHIAPTRNAHAHRKCLSGGEFITHIWALLWHYGIQKSSLWPNEVALANQAPAAPQKDETVQVSADGSMEQIGANVHEPDEIKGTQEHQAGSSRRGLTRMERTESSEIEEGSHDAIVEDRNFRQEWLVKPKMGVRRTS